MKLGLFVAALSLGLTQLSHAQEMSGAYMGFALGSLDYEEVDADLGIALSDTTSAYRLIGGYRFTDNFAVEAGWGATSDIEDSFSEVVPGFGTITVNVKADYEVLTVRALGIVPLTSLSLFGGVGYYDSELNASVSVTGFGAVGEAEGSDSGATLVGGLQYDLDRVSVRGEYEWFDTDSNVEVWDLSVGVLFRF